MLFTYPLIEHVRQFFKVLLVVGGHCITGHGLETNILVPLLLDAVNIRAVNSEEF